MALTFPTPPAPPTPPSAPRVVLEGGGSVNEMPRPKTYGPGLHKSGKLSDDEINEQKAKDAVAHGSGPLSKTTTEKDDSRNTQVTGNPRNTTERKDTAQTAQPKPREADNALKTEREGSKYVNLKEFQEDTRESQSQNQALTHSQPFRIKDADSGHGIFYWGFTIISVLALLIYLAKNYLVKNNDNKNSFSKRDLSYLTEETGETAKSLTEPVSHKPLNIVKNYETPKIPQTSKTEKNNTKKVLQKQEESKKESGHFEVRI